MLLRTRKIIILILPAIVIALANADALVAWLDHVGVVGTAQRVHAEYLNGTSITILLALIVLYPHSGRRVQHDKEARDCPVCGHQISRDGRYCSACGSRLRIS